MFKCKRVDETTTNPVKLFFAIILSIAMLAAMTPNLAPANTFADGDQLATESPTTPDTGAGQPASKGEDGEDGEDGATAEGGESALLYSVSFVLPAGYTYGDGSNIFTVQVSDGEYVAPASIPTVPAGSDDVFTGWQTTVAGSEMTLTPEQIENQPVTSDTQYTAQFEKIPGAQTDTDTAADDQTQTDADQSSKKQKGGINVQAAPPAGTFSIDRPLGNGTIDSGDSGKIIIIGEGVYQTFSGDAAGLQSAVSWLRSNGTGADYVMYIGADVTVPTGTGSGQYGQIAGPSGAFAGLQDRVGTLVITGLAGDPVNNTPATSAPTSNRLLTMDTSAVFFGCNIILRNIRHNLGNGSGSDNGVYMLGNDLTLGGGSWQTSETRYFGGGQSGNVSGDPTMTVYSTGTGDTVLVGGAYRGTLNGDINIAVHNSSGNPIDIYGGGYGGDGSPTLAEYTSNPSQRANVNGDVTTVVDGLATGAGGLRQYYGGVSSGDITGKITNTIKGPGRWNGDNGTSGSGGTNHFIGGSAVGNIGSNDASPESLENDEQAEIVQKVVDNPTTTILDQLPSGTDYAIANIFDTSTWTNGNAYTAGGNDIAGTIRGNIFNDFKSGSYDLGGVNAFQGSGAEPTNHDDTGVQDTLTGSQSFTWNSTTHKIENVSRAITYAETHCQYRQYGNITSYFRSGMMASGVGDYYTRGAGVGGFVKGNSYIDVGAEGMTWYATSTTAQFDASRNNTSGSGKDTVPFAAGDITKMYTDAKTSGPNNNGLNTGYDLVGSGGRESNTDSFMQVGDSYLRMRNIRARWTYGGLFGGAQIGNSTNHLDRGIVDTLEGTGYDGRWHVGDGTAIVKGGQVDFFLAGGGWSDTRQDGDSYVYVYDGPRLRTDGTPVPDTVDFDGDGNTSETAPASIVNCSMGGHYGVGDDQISGNATIWVSGGDFTGTSGHGVVSGFAPGASSEGDIWGDTSMTLDLRGNRYGFAIEKGDNVSAGRRTSAGGGSTVGTDASNTMTLNIFSDPGADPDMLNGMNLYGDAGGSATLARGGHIIMNINAPGQNLGGVYAQNYTNVVSNKINRDVEINLVSAKSIRGLSAGQPTDKFTNTIVAASSNKAVINIGPQAMINSNLPGATGPNGFEVYKKPNGQAYSGYYGSQMTEANTVPDPGDDGVLGTADDVDADYSFLMNWETGADGVLYTADDSVQSGGTYDGYASVINVGSQSGDTGITNFTELNINRRLLVAKYGDVRNGNQASMTAAQHKSDYSNFGDITLHAGDPDLENDGAGFGVENGQIAGGKLTSFGGGDTFVVSPGGDAKILLSDYLVDDDGDGSDSMLWLNNSNQSAYNGSASTWFGATSYFRVLTFAPASGDGSTEAKKVTPVNFRGLQITTKRNYIGDNQSAWGVCLPGSFYRWNVVNGSDGVSAGKIWFSVPGSSFNLGNDLTNGTLDAYGTSKPGQANASKTGAIAIPASKIPTPVGYPTFHFVPDSATGEWVKSLSVVRSDHGTSGHNHAAENEAQVAGSGKRCYSESEQTETSYQLNGAERIWQAGLTDTAPDNENTPNDKYYGFTITVDYTHTPELTAQSVILSESAAKALVKDGDTPKSDAQIILNVKGATNVHGRPFLTDDISASAALAALGEPLAEGEMYREFKISYYTHLQQGNQTSGANVSLTKKVSIAVVPDGTPMTTGAALVVNDAHMVVADAKGITAQRGASPDKKNIDYWTKAVTIVIASSGAVTTDAALLANEAAKVADFQATTAKKEISLSYSYTTEAGDTVTDSAHKAYITGALIDGVLWVDTNGNGKVDTAETDRFAGKNVKLYKSDGTLIDTNQTDSHGRYTFGSYDDTQLADDTSYYIVFPDLSSYGMTNYGNDRKTGSIDVDFDSVDDSYFVNDENYEGGFNGGYAWPKDPAIDTLKQSFNKKVWDAETGAWASGTLITNSQSVLTYRLQFKLPDNASDLIGFESIKIKDIMPNGLVYASSETDPFVVRVGGSDASSGDPLAGFSAAAVSYGAITPGNADNRSFVYYIIEGFDDPAVRTALAGKTINVYVKARLDKASNGGVYPTSVKNKGQLIVNEPDPNATSELTISDPLPGGVTTVTKEGIDGTPDPTPSAIVTDSAIIEGYLWYDAGANGGNGVFEADETSVSGVTVTLYAASDTSFSSPLATATTDANGKYKFTKTSDGTPLAAGSFVVRFPAIANYGYVTGAYTPAPDYKPDNTGKTQSITLDLDANQHKTANAGYARVVINTSQGAFTKDLTGVDLNGDGDFDDEGEATNGPIYDSKADLRYEIVYEMPTSTAGYNAIELLDLMDAGLALHSPAASSVKVTADGTDLTSDGTVDYYATSGGVHIVSFKFNDNFDFSTLAGKKIKMTVIANLSKVKNGENVAETESGAAWPTSVTNYGRLIVNNSTTPPINVGPNTESNTGRIYGTVFKDDNYDGAYQNTESLIGSLVVSLYHATDSALATPVQVATTGTDGKYSFDVPAGNYTVVFPTPYGADKHGITTTAPNAPITGVVTGVAISLGTDAEQTRKIDAGYNEPNPTVLNSIKETFNKYVKNPADGAWVPSPASVVTITNFNVPVEYKISFKVPTASGIDPFAGFSSIKLTDLVRDGLVLARADSGAANVVVKVGGDSGTVVYQSTAGEQSGTGAAFTFDAAKIAQYLVGKPAGTEVALYVKTDLVQYDHDGNPSTQENYGLLVEDTGSVYVNDKTPELISKDLAVGVAGNPPEIIFDEYPLVITQTSKSAIMTTAELKAEMQVKDDVDNPTWEASDATTNALFVTRTAVTTVGVPNIDKHNIGVYKVSYTATDSNDNQTTRTRAVVVTDGRYRIEVSDDDDDTNDIIIGARNYIAKSATLQGTMTEARSFSFADAYDGDGDALEVTWSGAPAGYVQNAAAGTYDITWLVTSFPSTTKTIKAIVTNADEIYAGGKSDNYALTANNFMRTTSEAAFMTSAFVDQSQQLISAAAVTVYKLVDDTDPDTPGNQPLPDKAPRIITNGNATTGPFSSAINTYPIDFGIADHPDTNHVTIKGIVNDGWPPVFTIKTPVDFPQGGTFGDAQYMTSVSAIDPDGDDNGTPSDPSDDLPLDITSDVKYGTLSGSSIIENSPVIPTKAGVYVVDYQVYDASDNHSEEKRVFVVNDGSYVVQGNILQAYSFITIIGDVTGVAANIKSELRSKSGAKAFNGTNGVPFDLTDDAVLSDGGYHKAAGTYTVAFTAADQPSGSINKTITAKVVSADAIAVGPTPANPESTDKYYVYGNNITLTTSEAQAIAGASDKNAALIAALSAKAEKVTGAGNISDATATIADDDNFSAANNIYNVKVKDAGGNATVTLTVTVSNGNGPIVTVTPVPKVIDTVTAAGNLTKAQIMDGVKVRDVEDTNNADTAWDALTVTEVAIVGGTPTISANTKSVNQVKYSYTDADGNPGTTQRAIVVNDGRYKVTDKYIIEANSFVVGKSQVDESATGLSTQLINLSNAKAWKIDGTPVTPVVKATGGYHKEIGSYDVVIGIEGESDATEFTKHIEAKVIDDSVPPSGGGGGGENGDRYSLIGNNFRINVPDATSWQSDTGTTYDNHFLSNTQVTSYLRASLQPNLVQSGTVKLKSVKKLGTGTEFKTDTLAEGDVYIATFYVDEEQTTELALRVLVSNANPPVLTVPEEKNISVGAIFPEGNWTDNPVTQPSYKGGVSANDTEDLDITSRVTYSGIVDNTQKSFNTVTYSVTDNDHNLTTQSGVVLVGDWVISGYAITADDFTKAVGSVTGTEAEAISEAHAVAYDLRRYLPDNTLNPDYGKAVDVFVRSFGGYDNRTVGEHSITFAVEDKPAVAITIKGTITGGEGPEIAFEDYPLVVLQTAASETMTVAELKAGLKVTDQEDNPTWEAADTALDLWKDTTAVPVGISSIDKHNIGVYKVSYTAKDAHNNQTTRTRAVVITDGRYEIDVTDDDDDTNDIIIGARNFVARAASINATEDQAKSFSFAEAYDGDGDAMTPHWTGAPAGYVAYGPTTITNAGDYWITWQVTGYTKTKTIKATVTNADEVYPGGKNDQYAIAANHFLRNTSQAAVMMGANLSANLIAAASATIYKLVDDTDPATPGNQPLPDRSAVVLTNGDITTGPFRDAVNTYPIDIAIGGLTSNHVVINGVVSNGWPPTLSVVTPKEVAQNGTYGDAQYRLDVTAVDQDGDKNGTPDDPSDDLPADITSRVKYGTISGSAFTEGTPVDTAKPGIYTVGYRVIDDDDNKADGKRIVVVNDGSYAVQGNILQAKSFVVKLADVTSFASDIKSELRSRTKVKATNGTNGNPIDLNDSAVTNDGGYHKAVGTYNITLTAPDAPSGNINKTVKGKVVDADVLVEGPETVDPTDTDRYFVYGNNITLTTSEAQAILGASNKNAALLTALDAHADKVTGDGTISDATATVQSDGGFSDSNGIYTIKVKDAGGHVTADLTATVSNGNGPTITVTPVPKVYDVTTSAGNLTKAQIMDGVKVTDAEDTGGVSTAWDALTVTEVAIVGGMPTIASNTKSVTQVTYKYTDADGNPATTSRAIIVNDGRYKIGDKYIIEANSFVIGQSEVSLPYETQILSRSDAKAWKIDGTPQTAVVKSTAGYNGSEVRSYKPTIGIDGVSENEFSKQIEAKVIDDSTPPSGGGGGGENGDRYSITANNFRINVPDATSWQSDTGATYDGHFTGNSLVASYLRASLQTELVASGTPKLEKVVKAAAPNQGVDFKTATLAEGDVFLATFYVDEEPATKVTIRVLVSNANPPVLTVPAAKVVSVGAVFPHGDWTDSPTASPSYKGGVSANDVEDLVLTQNVTYSGIVDTSTEGAFLVDYSVKDSDHNVVTEGGVVLVGDWVVASGYAILAHDFSKEIGDVLGTNDEVITASAAVAKDVRQYLADGVTRNPNFNKQVPAKVKSFGGYDAVTPGAFNIVIQVYDTSNPESYDVTIPIKATVGAGSGPVITFEDYPLVITQTSTSSIMTAADLKARMQVTDSEDNPTWEAADTALEIFTGTTAVPVGISQIDRHNIGVYKVTYTAKDQHNNSVTRTRAVVITDGRYVIQVTDDGNDDNDIIIGARNFVAKSAQINGTESQALSLSFAEAYDGDGDAKQVQWSGAPSGYIATDTVPGDYNITWYVTGYNSTTKTIKATIVNADEVYPGSKDDQYALTANNFLRYTSQAAIMVAGNTSAELISAAAVKVYKLVDDTDPDTPGAQPLPDKAPRVISSGSPATGPFSATENTYPIVFGIMDQPDSHYVQIDGVVSDGWPPTLSVTTPKEVAHNGIYGDAQYRFEVTAVDPDGNDNGTPNDASDDLPLDITSQVKYGTLSGTAIIEGTPVETDKPGVYAVDYKVTDAAGNSATGKRFVVVNDGSYKVQGNILKANSFVTKAEDVSTNPANIKGELRSKAGVTAINGKTGIPFDLHDDAVTNDGNYSSAAGIYNVTFEAADQPSGMLSKTIKAKVVSAEVLVTGPQPPDPTNTDKYYVYGNNIYLTTSEAQAIEGASNKNAALIAALDAHADKVTGDGTISDATATIQSDGGFSSANGIYTVEVKDAGGHAVAQLEVTVSNGNGPHITVTPVPLEIQTVASPTGNLTEAQIMGGVKVTDVEDTNSVETAWDALTVTRVAITGGLPTISANIKSVTQVKYSYTDADGNPATTQRAIVVNDGRYKVTDKYIIEANSFVIGKSEVNVTNPKPQIVTESNAKAWRLDGTAVEIEVKDVGAYTDTVGEYPGIVIGIQGESDPAYTKQITAKVYDDSTPPGGGGGGGENGDRYSIVANNFRINMTDAKLWQNDSGATYTAHFTDYATPVSYLRATQQTSLVQSGTVELVGNVVKAENPNQGVNFKNTTLNEGDVFLATFRVAEEPDTTVTIRVLVSDANKPVLTVPATKIVSVGAIFADGAWTDDPDANPSYKGGVSASDVEPPVTLTDRVTYNKPVDTSTEGAFLVTYSVTDEDHNTVSKGGVVLVGDWFIASGYAIQAHDFTKPVKEVQGTEAEMKTAAASRAIDVRQYLADGVTPNPNLGKDVPTKVKTDGGYYTKRPGVYDAVFQVNDPGNPESLEVTAPIKATIDAGDPPVITFTEAPLVISQSAVSHVLTESEVKAKMQVTDSEDNPTWEASDTNLAIFKNPASAGATGTSYEIRQGGDSGSKVSYIDSRNIGVYKVTYTTVDDHGNKVDKSRAIVVTDGRYIIDKTNEVIIGARGFVIAQEDVTGSESQARGSSYAEAFDIDGDQIGVSWTGVPKLNGTGADYAAKAAIGDYPITWQATGKAGVVVTKAITATVTDATVVDPGTKDSQYALIASDFIKTTEQAQAMVDSGNLTQQIIAAAKAQVIKLVPTAPTRAVRVVASGDETTGPFSAAPNTYSIRFGVQNVDDSELKAVIKGIVADGRGPVLTVTTPLEVWIGPAADKPATAIDASAWTADNMYGVTATDPDGDKHGTLDPGDDTATDITASVAAIADGDAVDTAKVGIYKVAYSVTDSDGNKATARRTVVVNDGIYTVNPVQGGRILEASSFEIKLADVATDAALKIAQIKGLTGVTLYDGETGDIIDDTSVRSDGGYTAAEASYNITMGGKDPKAAGGYITKAVVGKVVDAAVIVGPVTTPPGITGGDSYYAYGNDIEILPSVAQTLTTDNLILAALSAHADKVAAQGGISNAGVKIVSADRAGIAAGTVKLYKVVVSDTGGNVQIELKINVVQGNAPQIDTPKPIVVPVDPDNPNDLTKDDIMEGVTATDPDGDDNGTTDPSDDKAKDVTDDVIINPDGSGNEHVPSIKADEPGVTQVTYFVEDEDGNQCEVTTAVVVDDGSFVIDDNYILTARSFIIQVKDVTPGSAKDQILGESGSEAWDTAGNTATAYVADTNDYTNKKKDYFPVIGIAGYPSMTKQIQAKVVDDEITPVNGDQYSLTAKDFIINTYDANNLGNTYKNGIDVQTIGIGDAAETEFIKRAAATSYLRTGTTLALSGTVELVECYKQGDPGTKFGDEPLAEGDVYIAVLRIAEEPATTVSVKVTVSNRNAPVLTVPEAKVVSVGAVFGEAQYMYGVNAADIEDTDLTDKVSHDSPVTTVTKAAFDVEYEVTDSDHNTVSEGGMVFVGDWIIASGYAITADNFTKRLGQVVDANEAEAKAFAGAVAYDLRRTVNGQPNPNFKQQTPVSVTDDGGYYGKTVGTFSITFGVTAEPGVAITITARVTTGSLPVLTVPAYKKIDKGAAFDRNSTNPSYMSGVSATDIEDLDITSRVDYGNYGGDLVNPGADGSYSVVYDVTDSDSNLVTKAGVVLVGPWQPGVKYAIIAYDFSKTLGQVTGTTAEMISSAEARAICIDPSDPNYGKAATVTVADNGGYSKKVGTYNIKFAVQNEPATTITIKATVGTGNMPVLEVPAYKVVAVGATFGETQYMQGVSANDPEDGTITSKVKHDSPVNTAVEGYYLVNYTVTDNDGNTARRTGIVLVGPWVPGNGYAINASNFSKRVGQVLGTESEMKSSAKAQAVCIDPANANFGKSVPVSVTDDGGYPAKKAGSFKITFGVSADLGIKKTITATVTAGTPPVLTVPATRTTPLGAGFNYMVGVKATDAEDGTITSRVTYTTPVNTSSVGAYRVTYTITDSDGNRVTKDGVVLVGDGWVIKGGFALYAEDFARKLSQISGTKAEAKRLAKAMAVWIGNSTSSDFGKYVPVTVADDGGYSRKAGNYSIKFAVDSSVAPASASADNSAFATAVTKTIRASISDDTPKADVTNITNPTPRVVVNNPPAQQVVVNQPEPSTTTIVSSPAPVAAPVIVTVPAVEEPTEIEDEPTPLAAPEEPKYWHLLDLILAILAMILGFYLMLFAIRRKEEDDPQSEKRASRIRMWGQYGILLGLASIIVLLLTQDFTGKMELVDSWVILFAAIFGIEILAAVGVNSQKNSEWEEEREA
jgi:hypothetical protein